MKNSIFLFSLLTTLLLAACQPSMSTNENPNDEEDSRMMDDQMMEDMGGMGNMDEFMMDGNMGMMIHDDEDFLALMIPHHQEAIDTAQVILEKSENEDLKALAQDIVDAQTAEIEQMETWGKDWFGEEFKASEDYEEMMPDLSELEGEELDQAFIEGMIAHHQMAIMMAMHLQMITDREELEELAENIIEAQSTEVEMMGEWLK